MISATIFTIWLVSIILWAILSMECEWHWGWLIWFFMIPAWLIPVFTGVNIKTSDGEYKGYVSAFEQNGAIFKGWTAYLKTELESSNEDIACVDRDNKDLINKIKEAMVNKKNITLVYESVIQYKIGECPGSDWKIIDIK